MKAHTYLSNSQTNLDLALRALSLQFYKRNTWSDMSLYLLLWCRYPYIPFTENTKLTARVEMQGGGPG